MADKKYKLTISILASNRKDTLPKTLESVKPILDNDSTSPYIKALRTIYFGLTGEVDKLREINGRLS